MGDVSRLCSAVASACGTLPTTVPRHLSTPDRDANSRINGGQWPWGGWPERNQADTGCYTRCTVAWPPHVTHGGKILHSAPSRCLLAPRANHMSFEVTGAT